jgi:hypothetical protein
MSLSRPAQLADAGRRRPRAAADRALQLVDVLRELAFTPFELLLQSRQLAPPALDTLLAQHHVRLELGLAGEQFMLPFLQLLLGELDRLPALGETNALRGCQIVGRSELGLAFAQPSGPFFELRLLYSQPILALGDLDRAPGQLTVVSARGQGFPQARHLLRGDLDAEDERVSDGVVGHGGPIGA